MSATATSTFTVRVLLFASYAEMLGMEALELVFSPGATLRDALDHVRSLPGGERLPPKPLCAVNLTQAQPDAVLADGDEIAVLPPLAGG
jgi:molybdopterin converting factor small subunit